MLCKHCGKEIPDIAKVCTHCGKPVGEEDSAPAEKKRRGGGFLAILLAALMISLAVGALVYFGAVDIPAVAELLGAIGLPPVTETAETLPPETVPVATQDNSDETYRQVLAHCRALAQEGQFEAAVDYLNKCMAEHSMDPRFQQLLDKYTAAHWEAVLSKADTLASEGMHVRAIAMVDALQRSYGSGELLTMAGNYRMNFAIYNLSMFAAGKYNTFLLNEDGTVTVYGERDYDEDDAKYWSDITGISAGDRHVLGLRADRKVVAVGGNDEGQIYVDFWDNVAVISAGDTHSVALSYDGRLFATGYNEYRQCDVALLEKLAGGRRIVSVAAGYVHTLALLEDGTVLACGSNATGACDVGNWTDIVAIFAGSEYSAGLKSDGTVVVTGLDTDKWDVSGWTDIANLSAGDYYLIGLRENGTVLSADANTKGDSSQRYLDVEGWDGILFVAAGRDHTVGLRSNGKLVAVGSNSEGQRGCDGKRFRD